MLTVPFDKGFNSVNDAPFTIFSITNLQIKSPHPLVEAYFSYFYEKIALFHKIILKSCLIFFIYKIWKIARNKS